MLKHLIFRGKGKLKAGVRGKRARCLVYNEEWCDWYKSQHSVHSGWTTDFWRTSPSLCQQDEFFLHHFCLVAVKSLPDYPTKWPPLSHWGEKKQAVLESHFMGSSASVYSGVNNCKITWLVLPSWQLCLQSKSILLLLLLLLSSD